MKEKMIKNPENKMEKMQKSTNKDIEELKNKHTNSTITEIKNTLEVINSKISEAEEWISELEDKMVEINFWRTESSEKNEKNWGYEDSLRDLWGNINCTNIPIIGIPEEEKKGMRKFLKRL